MKTFLVCLALLALVGCPSDQPRSEEAAQIEANVKSAISPGTYGPPTAPNFAAKD